MEEDCFHLGAKALICNAEGKVLLLYSNSSRSRKKASYWDLPGGRVRKNEALEEGLKREVYEETGLQNIVRITPFLMVQASIRIPVGESDVGLIFSTYLCDVAHCSSICLSEEHVDFGWFWPHEAADRLSESSYPEALTSKLAGLTLTREGASL